MAAFDLAAYSDAVADVAAKAAPVAAAVHVGEGRFASAFHVGEGLFVGAEELIEVDDVTTLVLPDGAETKASILGRDPSTGIILLKPEAQGAWPVLDAAAPVRAGHVAIATGRGESGLITAVGNVREAGPAWHSMRGGTIDRRILLSIHASHAFEGGPVIDARGALIGVLLFGPKRRAIVVPHETIARAVAALAKNGHVSRGYLGASLHPVHDARLKGAMVMRLDEDGPARKAGLQIGDIITGWNGDPITGPRGLIRKLGTDSVGADVKLKVVRGGESREVTVTIGGKPLT